MKIWQATRSTTRRGKSESWADSCSPAMQPRVSKLCSFSFPHVTVGHAVPSCLQKGACLVDSAWWIDRIRAIQRACFSYVVSPSVERKIVLCWPTLPVLRVGVDCRGDGGFLCRWPLSLKTGGQVEFNVWSPPRCKISWGTYLQIFDNRAHIHDDDVILQPGAHPWMYAMQALLFQAQVCFDDSSCTVIPSWMQWEDGHFV